MVTLTYSIHRRNPFGHRLRAAPFHFDEPETLIESLRGVSVLYNTCWVRFNYRTFTRADTVRTTMTLFEAAKAAEVQRIVHVSITNPSEDSPFEYFSGKARLERVPIENGVSYAPSLPTHGAVRKGGHPREQHRTDITTPTGRTDRPYPERPRLLSTTYSSFSIMAQCLVG